MKLKSIKRKNKMHSNPFAAKVNDSQKFVRVRVSDIGFTNGSIINFTRDQRWNNKRGRKWL